MKRINCDKDWRFYESDEGNSFLFEYPEGELVDLPHDFIIRKPRSADAPGGASNGYFGNGEGVYRKTLDIPMDWKGKTVLLDVDGAYMNMEVSLNREVLAIHPNGYIPYQVDLTPALRFDGKKNQLKIITQSRQPSSRWYAGGGLYRDVCLWVGGEVHVKPWEVFVSTPYISEKSAIVKLQMEITAPEKVQDITLHCQILDGQGKTAGEIKKQVRLAGNKKETAELIVEHPKLWDLEHPYQYTYKITLHSEEEIFDTAEGTFGIRKIEVDAVNGFRLNGKSMKLKGGCIHHDNGLLGACAYPKAEARKIDKLKAAGYNTVRISHYPPSLAMLNYCDRIGMLLMDEAFDVWTLGKIPMDYHLNFADWWDKDIENMVKRDRNHPCVITYSIGNEICESNGKNHGAEWSEKLADKVREFDDTRPVLSAICGLAPEEEQAGGNFAANLSGKQEDWNTATAGYCAPLDIVGYNYLKDLYEESHERFPERVILATETHPFLTYDYWQKAEELPYVIGDCIWAAVDYLGEAGVGKVFWDNDHEEFELRGPYPWRTSWQADFDLTGEQRPQSVFREIMWGRTEKSGIFTTHPRHYGEGFKGSNWHWYDVNDCWDFEECWLGKPVKVDVYGAGDEAEFLLNGESLGRAPFEKLIATLDVAYVPGILEAVVYKNGERISSCKIATAGKAERIRLTAETESFRADGKDLCFIRAELTDIEGNRLMYDERKISVKVSGKGIFVTAGSANPCTDDQITAKECHLYRGTAVIAVKAKEAGTVVVTVKGEGVKEGSVTVEAEKVPD